jgi:hypothetical protein
LKLIQDFQLFSTSRNAASQIPPKHKIAHFSEHEHSITNPPLSFQRSIRSGHSIHQIIFINSHSVSPPVTDAVAAVEETTAATAAVTVEKLVRTIGAFADCRPDYLLPRRVL